METTEKNRENRNVTTNVTMNGDIAINLCCDCDGGNNNDCGGIKFDGFDVFPIGKAKLSIKDGVLKVDNIGSSGLDGVLVKFDEKDKDSHTINFGDLSTIINNKGVLKTSTLRKNPIGQVITSFESFKWFNNRDKVMFGYNLSFLPENSKFFGRLNNEIVFEMNLSDIVYQNIPTTRIWPAVIAAAAAVGIAVWNGLRTKKTTTTVNHYDANGRLTGSTVTTTEDPIPFEVEVKGKKYVINELGIEYENKIPENMIGDPALDFHAVGEQITGYNLSSFEITSIN